MFEDHPQCFTWSTETGIIHQIILRPKVHGNRHLHIYRQWVHVLICQKILWCGEIIDINMLWAVIIEWLIKLSWKITEIYWLLHFTFFLSTIILLTWNCSILLPAYFLKWSLHANHDLYTLLGSWSETISRFLMTLNNWMYRLTYWNVCAGDLTKHLCVDRHNYKGDIWTVFHQSEVLRGAGDFLSV